MDWGGWLKGFKGLEYLLYNMRFGDDRRDEMEDELCCCCSSG